MGKSKKHERKFKVKHKRKERKDKKKKSKKHSKDKKRDDEGNGRKTNQKIDIATNALMDDKSNDFSIPVELMNNKSHAPETPEEYEQRQSRIRRETDPITGRSRLIKGDGEVLEEIVSKERHKTINKETTKGDASPWAKRSRYKLLITFEDNVHFKCKICSTKQEQRQQ